MHQRYLGMLSNRKLILVIVMLVTVTVTAYVLLVVLPRHFAEQSYDGARKLGRDLREAFQFSPEIRVENKVIVEREAPALELATVSQRFHHRTTWTNTRFGSTKEIEITGTFEAKAGFDLQEQFQITLDDGKAIVIFPSPKMLSVTPVNDVEFRDESGIWNWVNQDDRTTALNYFLGEARQKASAADLLEKARHEMIKTIVPLLRPHAENVEIHTGDQVYRLNSLELKDGDLPGRVN
jgi:hypothetical protein